MFLKRKLAVAFGNGKEGENADKGLVGKKPRLGGSSSSSFSLINKGNQIQAHNNNSHLNSIFSNRNNKLVCIQRAPFFAGGGVAAVTAKKFQRPSMKRRAYGKAADVALQQSTLGPRRSMNGLAKLLARAGKGLAYKLPQQRAGDATDEASQSDSESDQDKEPDRPFQPLRVWRSPHGSNASDINASNSNSNNNNHDDDSDSDDDDEPLERKGLPPRQVQITRPDEYGVEETVTVWQPAPVSAYAKRDAYVPPVLAKWLRPHQREGVHFMYKCVMGLKEYDGCGWYVMNDVRRCKHASNEMHPHL